MTRPLRIASVMEAVTVTGVAKALLAFYKTARAQRAAEVQLFTFARGSASSSIPDNSFLSTLRDLDFPVTVIPERGPLDPQSVRALWRMLEHQSPDIVETHAVKSHVLLRLRRPRTPKWVAFHHGYTQQDFKMRLYNRLNPWALRRADQVVTVCRPFLENLVAAGVQQQAIAVIPNAIEPGALPTREATAPKTTRTILSVGRLSAEKGHSDLIAALGLLRDARPELDLKLILVGDGPERATLQAQVRQLHVDNRVSFAGQQSSTESFYAAADLFVLPSLSEGSPLVLLEAMQAGLPIVATRVGGVPETLRDRQSALLIPPQQPSLLCDAMERLLTDQDLAHRLTQQAASDVAAHHTPEIYTQTLLALYRKLKS